MKPKDFVLVDSIEAKKTVNEWTRKKGFKNHWDQKPLGTDEFNTPHLIALDDGYRMPVGIVKRSRVMSIDEFKRWRNEAK